MNKLKLHLNEDSIEIGCLDEEQKVIKKWEKLTELPISGVEAGFGYPKVLIVRLGYVKTGIGDVKASEWLARFEEKEFQQIDPVDSHPFYTYELVNYDSPEGTSLVMGSFAKCKEELRPGNILRPLDKSQFIRYNDDKLYDMRKRAQTASTEELRSMVYQCLDALGE
jgi:hypothetical protein